MSTASTSRRTPRWPGGFQPIFVSEPTVEDTISILRGLKEKYELHHGVRITDSALVAAATFSNRYITDRFLPDKAIDLVDEAASRLKMEIDSKPEELDAIDRDLMQMRIEREALRKETDAASKERLARLDKSIVELEEKSKILSQRWEGEKKKLGQAQKLKEELDQRRTELEQAQRRGNLARAGELAYGVIPGLEKKLKELEGAEAKGAMVEEAVTPDHIAQIVAALDRHSGRADARRRARQAAAHGGGAWQARRRPARGRRGRIDRRQARPRGSAGPQQAARLFHLPGADRRRQDRADQGVGRLPVRQRDGHGSPRYERVHGKALRGPASSAPLRVTSATRKAARSPKRSAAGPIRSCCSTRSRRRTPTSSTCCCRCSTTVASPTARVAPSTSRTR